jgi:flagellar hook-associated protein 3 FlgL
MTSVHRVTQTSMTTSALRGLQAGLNRAQDLQNTLSLGKKLAKPSDNPAGLATTMQLRSQARQDERYLSTIQAATDRLQTADSALQNVSTMINRAKQLLVNAANGSLDDTARESIASELDVLNRSAIDAYNTTYQDRPVFGGSVQGAVAIDDSGSYIGNDADLVARISRSVTLRVDVKGSDAGADALPDLLAKAAEDVRSGSSDITDDEDQLDALLNKVVTVLGDVGARGAQLEATKTRITSEQVDLSSRISSIEDADLASTIMQLSSAQVAYQAALGSASKIMQTSLMDYLK